MQNNQNNNTVYNQIVQKADIVEVISEHVKLEKKGNNFIGLCPFHEDTNPSMSVSPEKKIFKCFSCNTGGTVIEFVSLIKNISKSEAKRELGNKYGINVQLTPKELEFQRNKIYYDSVAEAANFYSFYLKNGKESPHAKDYLMKRGIDNKIIDYFKIGLSGSDNQIYQLINTRNYLALDYINVGLIRSSNSKYFDTFKNRIMFPLEDLEGNICGFSGRRYLKDDASSKYLNTEDTVIFKKGQILYNFKKAKTIIKQKDSVFLFEGFMDVIAAYRSGVENAVASMGTALTTNQVQALSKITKNIVIVYDSDEAGITATIKAIDLCLRLGITPKVVSIPEGLDPDEYLSKYGPNKLNSILIDNQTIAMEFIYNYYKQGLIPDDLSSLEKFKENVFSKLFNFKSSSIADIYLQKMVDDFGLSLRGLTNDYEHKKREMPVIQDYELPVPTYDEIPIPIIRRKIPSHQYLKFEKSEEALIKASYENRINCREIYSKLENHFCKKINKVILETIDGYYINHERMNQEDLLKQLSTHQQQKLLEILSNTRIPQKKEIERHIKNVKQVSTAKAVDQYANISQKKIEDVENLIKSKTVITKISKKKE